jgi:hypothetical protein
VASPLTQERTHDVLALTHLAQALDPSRLVVGNEPLATVDASDALAGLCYTRLTDTFQEQNGLLTMDRRPKADAAALALATRGTGGRTS